MKEEALKRITNYPEETEGYWKQQQSAFLASGLSRKRYCREHEVNYDRFSYWLRKLSSHQRAVQSGKESALKNGSLLPVQISQEKQDTSPTTLCTLNLKNGHSLIIHTVEVIMLLSFNAPIWFYSQSASLIRKTHNYR